MLAFQIQMLDVTTLLILISILNLTASCIFTLTIETTSPKTKEAVGIVDMR